ncbi:MAG: CinA family nicotinamide mononucleotide deamidase-related protein [Planctomycetota bacterium]
MTAPRLEILAIGDELAHGSCIDTNSAHIARECEALGLAAPRFSIVCDDPTEIEAVMRDAVARADVVIATGGLGPTEDDRSRHAAAAAAGVPLEFDAAAWAEIEAYFRARGRVARDDNRRQALMPRGAIRLTNDWGTAPGVALAIGRAELFLLPGVPSEMRQMLTHCVLPRVRARLSGRLRPVEFRQLVVVGPTEAALGQRLADLMAADAVVKVGITPHFGVLTIRVAAHGTDPSNAAAAADAVATEIRSRLGEDLIYEGVDDLPTALLKEAAAAGVRIATAESCTGGLVAKFLTDPPGASAIYLGGYVAYHNDRKVTDLSVSSALLRDEGAVSEAVAAAMARGAASRTGAELALATTGIAGPDGGTDTKPVGTVCFAMAHAGDVVTWTRRFPAIGREFVRHRAAFDVLAAAMRRVREHG